jgi:hypothetical protein
VLEQDGPNGSLACEILKVFRAEPRFLKKKQRPQCNLLPDIDSSNGVIGFSYLRVGSFATRSFSSENEQLKFFPNDEFPMACIGRLHG